MGKAPISAALPEKEKNWEYNRDRERNILSDWSRTTDWTGQVIWVLFGSGPRALYKHVQLLKGHSCHTAFPAKLKSKSRTSVIIVFRPFRHSVLAHFFCFFLLLYIVLLAIVFLPFTVSVSLRVFWGITLASSLSFGSVRISHSKYLAFCGSYSAACSTLSISARFVHNVLAPPYCISM